MTQSTNNLQVANTIRDQIGNRALFMMGARDLMGEANALRFRISGSQVTHIRVSLTVMDEYDIEFWNRKGEITTKIEGAYADNLREIIADHTKLILSL